MDNRWILTQMKWHLLKAFQCSVGLWNTHTLHHTQDTIGEWPADNRRNRKVIISRHHNDHTYITHSHLLKGEDCPVGWGCRIHRLHFCQGVRTPLPNKCPAYDTNQFYEVPVMLELWGMWSTPSLPLLSGTLWPGVVAPDRVLPLWVQ